MTWIEWLFNDNGFMTRNQCGPGWTPNFIAAYQLAQILIAISYLSIPLSLLSLYIKIRKVKIFAKYNPWIILMFVGFITSCATSHLSHIFVFYYPIYHLYLTIDIITAVVSLITAIILPLVIYRLIKAIPNDPKL